MGELSAKFATQSGMDVGGALKLATTMSAVAGAMRAYSSLIGVKNSSTNWIDLDPKIRTIYVDLLYQGLSPSFSRANLIPAMQSNDLNEFKNGLSLYDTDPTGMRFKNRNAIRLDYLK